MKTNASFQPTNRVTTQFYAESLCLLSVYLHCWVWIDEEFTSVLEVFTVLVTRRLIKRS